MEENVARISVFDVDVLVWQALTTGGWLVALRALKITVYPGMCRATTLDGERQHYGWIRL